ncbi:hypothetical protein N0V91_003428 [Didymella pomorum]|jgi:hypothetical protein|uniref:Uncharacterized protein n=1 Tax=Didymella pomorum TaxID=749634 RepID=A0A9W8ZKD4_9PLEO|nr:hypothetical protein N0V91_003428 [Didymella pomorum]
MPLVTRLADNSDLSFHAQPSNIILRKRATTFPKRFNKACKRANQIACHLPRSSTFFPIRRPQEQVAHDTTTQDQASSAMTTKRDAPKESRECLMCKRKFDDEEDKPSKVAKKDAAVDIDQPVEDVMKQLPPFPNPLPERHARFEHCMPPDDPKYTGDKSVFLAGSIEMGKAVQWQKQMAATLQDLPVTLCNPRRGAWDPNVTKSAKDAAFKQQVVWELTALEKATIIIFFFDANTVSPVTMMELGLWASSGKVIVCCDSRFWRAGNIHLVCERYKVPYVEKFEDLVTAVKERLFNEGLKLD